MTENVTTTAEAEDIAKRLLKEAAAEEYHATVIPLTEEEANRTSIPLSAEKTELNPRIEPCHPGCEAQFGDAVEPCGALVRTIEHEAIPCDDPCCGPHEAWTQEIHCNRVPHADGAHDEHAQPVIWYDSAHAPLVYGKAYGVRMRCRQAGTGPGIVFKAVSQPSI